MSYPNKNKPEGYLKNNIEKFIKNAAGSNLSEIQNWLNSTGVITHLHKNLKKEQNVFTLLSPEISKSINSFFHPPKISLAEKEILLDSLLKTNDKNGILIKGRLGQGKSILLKYLHFLELNTGCSLPIFLELRKIKSPSLIIKSATEKIESMGLTCSNKLFTFLLNEGHISLFLDGFDELPLDARDEFNQSLSKLCTKYSQSKILVTTRHDTEICKNSNFVGFNISLLKKADIAPFVKKTLAKQSLAESILAKIEESDEFDFDVLDTPLLMTWFITVYKRRLKIPKTKLGFYEDLFSAILSRHDGFKESYNRATKSKLLDDEIKSVFCALCYLTRKAEVSIFSENVILSFIQQALNASNFKNVSASDYLYDLTHVTCLLKKDGLDYEFIHESVAQYFSASFIKSTSERNAIKFYTHRLDAWKVFEEELKFLSEIDPIRYNEYFYIPSIMKVLKRLNDDNYILQDGFIRSYLGGTELACLKTKSDTVSLLKNPEGVILITIPTFSYVLYSSRIDENFNIKLMMPPSKFLREKILNSSDLLTSFSRIISKKEEFSLEGDNYIYYGAVAILKKLKLKHAIESEMSDNVIKIMLTKLKKAEALINQEKEKGSLF